MSCPCFFPSVSIHKSRPFALLLTYLSHRSLRFSRPLHHFIHRTHRTHRTAPHLIFYHVSLQSSPLFRSIHPSLDSRTVAFGHSLHHPGGCSWSIARISYVSVFCLSCRAVYGVVFTSGVDCDSPHLHPGGFSKVMPTLSCAPTELSIGSH